MKNIAYLLVGLIFISLTAHANTTAENLSNSTLTYNSGYGKSFIFVENGIEFSIFPDGQYDFNIIRNTANINISIGSPNLNFSFNSGYDYNAYVQYDEFGAIIQIENTPIYYDHYGRITQAGLVNINYNTQGYVNRVGGLNIYYNRYNQYSHYSGFINTYNRNYVYRAWHRYYSVPNSNYRVVYNRPYRQYYTPSRYTYIKPFYNKQRPRTAVANRRGDVIYKNKKYATVNRSNRNVTSLNTRSNSQRPNASSTYKNRSNLKYTPSSSGNNVSRTTSRRTTVSNNTTTTRIITTTRNTKQTKSNVSKRVQNNYAQQNPKSTNTRIYNRNENKSRSSQVAQRSQLNSVNTSGRKVTQSRVNSSKDKRSTSNIRS